MGAGACGRFKSPAPPMKLEALARPARADLRPQTLNGAEPIRTPMERRGRGRRTQETETIARERIEILFAEARRAVGAGRVDRAKRYVVLARRGRMRHN